MNIYQRNKRLKEQILKPENCHCTYRKIDVDSDKTATAYCTSTGKVKANIDWHHTATKTRIKLVLPIGVEYTSIVLATDGLEALDAGILSLFIKMDAAWHEAGDDEHTHTDHS